MMAKDYGGLPQDIEATVTAEWFDRYLHMKAEEAKQAKRKSRNKRSGPDLLAGGEMPG